MADARSIAARHSRLSVPFGVAVVAFLLCTVVAIRVAVSRTGGHLVYSLDDTYIHMAMGRTLALHGVWGCTPYRFASGSSSPLWVVALALTGVLGELAPLLLNIALGVATLGVCDWWLRRWAAPWPLRLATLLGVGIVIPLPGMVLYGMEHVLHTLLTLTFAALSVETIRGRDEAPHRLRNLAVLGALLGASRYEGLFLVGLTCVALVLVRRWRDAVVLGGVAAAPVTLLGFVSLVNGSPFLPNPLVIKAGGENAALLSSLFKPIGASDWQALQQNPTLLMIALGAIGVAALAWWRTRSARAVSVSMPALLALAIALHVHFAFSSTFWQYRYDAYLLAFAVFTCGMVLADAAAGGTRAPRRGAASAVVVAAMVLWLGDVQAAATAEEAIEGTGAAYREHYRLADFVARFYPDHAVVVNDIGLMAYRSNANVLDMFGLCDPEPVRARRAHSGYTKADVRQWAERRGAQLAIVQLSWGWVPPHVPDEWRRVASLRLPFDRSIGIYAIAPGLSVVGLRADLVDYFGPLIASEGYALRLD